MVVLCNSFFPVLSEISLFATDIARFGTQAPNSILLGLLSSSSEGGRLRQAQGEPEGFRSEQGVAHQHQESLTAPRRKQIYFTDAIMASGGLRFDATKLHTILDNYGILNIFEIY
jgi:hypothetical protein